MELQARMNGLLKAELKRRTIGYRELAERLGAMGVHDSERNIANKINRGGFTAVFLVQCLEAIGATSLRLIGWLILGAAQAPEPTKAANQDHSSREIADSSMESRRRIGTRPKALNARKKGAHGWPPPDILEERGPDTCHRLSGGTTAWTTTVCVQQPASAPSAPKHPLI